jgi:hypothetical protein
MRTFLGIASLVSAGAAGAAAIAARRPARPVRALSAQAPDPAQVARSIDDARARLRARASSDGTPGHAA